VIDGSDISATGLAQDIMTAFENDAIWRIPPIPITIKVKERSDSRRLAESLAVQYAGGMAFSKAAHSASEDDDESADE
jgi:hypothetical protein